MRAALYCASVREPPYVLERLGTVMEPDPNDAQEAWGVLNPAAARGRDGELYLFPRLVAEGNFSRIGRARVLFEGDRPTGVERLGVVLDPDETWEQNEETGGGVEDPRITFVAELDTYVMAYAAYGPLGPRVALAASFDLEAWERLGPAQFASEPQPNVDTVTNKDAVLFPELVPAPDGSPSYALLHRPTFGLPNEQPGIWVSFAAADGGVPTRFGQHRPVAFPAQRWEAAKIGAGTPPVRTAEGWLVVHHGVSAELHYSAGALVLDTVDVTRVVARSRAPLLAPETKGEREGIVENVVFPTAIDGEDVYYGMADARIGVARLRRT
jgi:predicted GH43/DUF377 family glycosyl hydrolase